MELDVMEQHPTREALAGFLNSTLPAPEAKGVIAHLLGGCLRCQDVMAPLALSLFRPGRDAARLPLAPPAAAAANVEEDTAYEGAIDAAFAAVLARTHAQIAQSAQSSLPQPGDPAFATPATCAAYLEASRERLNEPAEMIYLSALAVRAATAVDGEPAAAAADLRARAWAELANAHRVAGDLAAAEAAMARAVDEREAGTGALLLLARIADLAGSLCGARRRFLDAFRLLDIAHELYRRQGEIHAAGRVLIAKGLYAGYSGDADEGIQLLVRGLESIDRDREPKLAFQALHNLLLFWVDLGLYDQALRHLRQMRPLYKRYAGPVERVKLRWVEGKIAAGLGDLRRAEAAFLRARNEYAAAGLGFRAALTALDLAAVWLRQGRTAELQPLVGEMLAAFRAAGAGREALAAVLLLHEAVERQQATLELLDRIAATLGRIERQRAPQPAPDVA